MLSMKGGREEVKEGQSIYEAGGECVLEVLRNAAVVANRQRGQAREGSAGFDGLPPTGAAASRRGAEDSSATQHQRRS